uniref:EGF-like domain-containing protein n=1 Tax=Quercus lobata TaxID=97700 RepID=A0A7N2MLF5_QUELO
MGFLGMLMQVIRVGVILSATMAAAAIAFPIALPECPDICGKVKIPYPYGTTEGCYLNDTAIFGYYFINCTTNTNGQPQPMIGNLNVTSISMEGEIDIQIYNSIDCYEESGRSLPKKTPTLNLPSFTVSATKNKFVAVGCDTYAYLNGYLNDQPFTIGCLSYCQNISNVVNGTCSGIGCCEIQIPEGLKNVDFTAYSFNGNHTKVWDFNPCSFAFIVQEDKFNFSSGYLTSLRNNLTLPMVLDWTIGNETCKVAQNKANYICGANTTCSDLNNGSGYRCKCKDGYEGNPYLEQGCQGIYSIYLQIYKTKIKERNTITIF